MNNNLSDLPIVMQQRLLKIQEKFNLVDIQRHIRFGFQKEGEKTLFVFHQAEGVSEVVQQEIDKVFLLGNRA